MQNVKGVNEGTMAKRRASMGCVTIGEKKIVATMDGASLC